MQRVLIELKNAGVRRAGRDLLSGVDWTLREGEHWAVLGENGAGKSTFLRLVRGELPPTSGSRTYFLDHEPQSTPIGIRERLPLVSPEMQEVYAAPDGHDPLPMRRQPGLEAVLAGLHDSRLLYQDPGPEARERAQALLAELGLAGLAVRPVQAMSTGQLRSILLARAVFSVQDAGPAVLLLDECLDGLDRTARQAMLGLMEALGRRLPLLVAAHRAEDLPYCVNRVLRLEAGRMVSQGEYQRRTDRGRGDSCGNQAEDGAQAANAAPQGQAADQAAPSNKNAPLHQDTSDKDGFLFRLDGVSVVLEGKPVLQDIHWTVHPGEHWALVGENGAGKSTLLRLILGLAEPYGENWPHYFGQTGPMELVEVRRRFGWLSTELQTAFDRRATVRQAVLTGFFGGMELRQNPTHEQEDAAREAMALFGLEPMADKPLAALSFGQVRRALLARAVAPKPEMLLLDEPLSGLDAAARKVALKAIESLAASGSGLVWISHRQGEMPDCVDRVLALEKGRTACFGGRECLG